MKAEIPESLLACMVKQDFSAEFLNRVANHPDVRPFIGDPDGAEVDLALLADNSIFLVTEHGGFVFQRFDPGYYCLHTMFLPEGRGKHVALAARDAFFWMFTRTDAVDIVTYSPRARPGSRPPRTMGWRNWYEGGEYDAYRLALMDWASHAPALMDWGREFAPEGSPAEQRFMGMGKAMAFYGQPAKGAFHFNRWAQIAGAQLLLPTELENEVMTCQPQQ